MSDNPLNNLKKGLRETRFQSLNRLQIIRNPSALVMHDSETNVTLVVSFVNSLYTVGAVVDTTTYTIARNTDAGTAALAVREAATHHIALAPFSVALSALSELLQREA